VTVWISSISRVRVGVAGYLNIGDQCLISNRVFPDVEK
jgi:hypothetical protein